MTDADRTGVVLAGGYSTRFGSRDKALADVGGEPMLRRVVSRLSVAADAVVVNCREDQRAEFSRVLNDVPVQFVVDPHQDGGPLVGLKATFDEIQSRYTAVVACDMPGVDPAFLSYLFDRAGGHDAALPELRDDHFQPVQAVYRTEPTVQAAEQQLADGRRSLHGMLEHLDVALISKEEVAEHTDWRSLTDVNTCEELESFDARSW